MAVPAGLGRRRVAAWIAIPFVVALVTLVGRVGGANATTAGFAYLIAVLALATWGGWAAGAVASIAATLSFNFFFFPPHGTLTIADPANWVALFAFLIASTVASRLVATARREAEEAQRRQRQVEFLFEERERLRAEAAHLEAVKASDALKTSLLRAVSHDLRTPLTAMRLEIESLDRQLADRPAALASVRGLSLEQERLARRIDNLLSLARLEAGVARPHPEPVPAGALFRAARESLSLVLDARPVEVRIEARCPDLWADPSLTLEALVNLLENAARAAPSESPIELAAGLDPQAPERVRLEVRDRGPGLPAGVHRLLEIPRELRRAAAGSGDSASGGLGLMIARGLAEANSGSLELLDRPGGGTVARLVLPAAPEPEEVPE
jgi:two-component system, OmpR family, sensor histidine kinase KdpD